MREARNFVKGEGPLPFHKITKSVKNYFTRIVNTDIDF